MLFLDSRPVIPRLNFDSIAQQVEFAAALDELELAALPHLRWGPLKQEHKIEKVLENGVPHPLQLTDAPAG